MATNRTELLKKRCVITLLHNFGRYFFEQFYIGNDRNFFIAQVLFNAFALYEKPVIFNPDFAFDAR
jgi:hypothetical protein